MNTKLIVFVILALLAIRDYGSSAKAELNDEL